jgi:hypothetical protein
MFQHHPSARDFYRFTHERLQQLFEDAGLQIDEMSAQWGATAGVQIPLNLLGTALDQIEIARRFKSGNLGVSNYTVVARKP